MARKRQTTGLPKESAPSKETPETTEPTTGSSIRNRVGAALGQQTGREYKSRAEREAEIQRLVIIWTAVAVGFVLIVLAIAFIADGLIRPNQAVAVANGDTISVSAFEQRVKLERAIIIEQINNALNDYIEVTDSDVETAGQFVLSQEPFASWWNELNVPEQMGIRVLDDMVNEKFIRAEAQERGITVSDEEIDNKINDLIGYDPEQVAQIGVDPTATPEPTITPTPFVSPTPSPEPTAAPTTEPTVEAAAGTDEEAADEATDETTDETNGEADETTDEETGAADDIQVTAAPTPTPQPTLSREEVEANFADIREDFLNDVRSTSGLGENEIRDYFEFLVIREKLGEALAGSDSTSTYADVRHILVNTEEEALDIIAALEAGESFADLARAKSTDEGSGANGGELSMRGTFEYVAPFAEAVENAEIGEIVGPVESEFGYHIIQVRSKEEREAEENAIELARNREIEQWVEDARASEENEFEIYSIWIDNVPSTPGFIYEPRA